MLGPKSRVSSTRLGGSGSLLKKPAVTSTMLNQQKPAQNVSAAASRQASQCSLLAAGKSTSRCSIQSDATNVSICSSSLNGASSGARQSSDKSGRISANSLARTNSSLRPTKAAPSKKSPSSISSQASSISSSSSSAAAQQVGAGVGARSLAAGANRTKLVVQQPTLAMSLREKENQIKLLIKERDEQRLQAEVMARKAEQWEEKFVQSELEKSHVTSEADDEVVELRRLAQELEDENKVLCEKLISKEQLIGDTQFKLDELECEKLELRRELEEKEEILELISREDRGQQDERLAEDGEQQQQQPSRVDKIKIERALKISKYDKEIDELKEKLTYRDEQIIQLRTSLEMKKNEVQNLQTHSADLERKLKIESERSERHLKRLDEINLEIKASEAKLSTKLEENEVLDKQVRQLRQELRTAEDKVEQLSLARKKDVDILHNKLSAARRGSTTPTSPQPYKTPTPQDEIVRLQMEIRDLKDQLIDREAELDCNRRDLDVMKRKMETRTLEVDCNNQELARRCQDLLEQNRQSEDTVKQLLMSTTEHSAQLIRATDDLKEANGKCIKLREEISELETKLEEQVKKSSQLMKENLELKDDNEEYKEQVDRMRSQIDSLNEQLTELCEQLDLQTQNLHKDREQLAQQLSMNDIDLAQLKSDLANAKQDLRSQKLQQQEIMSERDRIRMDLEMKEKYISSRNEVIETMRCELEDCRKSLQDSKIKIDELREAVDEERDRANKEIKTQLEPLKKELQVKCEVNGALKAKCDQLAKKLLETRTSHEEDELKKFDELRKKYLTEIESLKSKIQELEDQLDELKTCTLKRAPNSISQQQKQKLEPEPQKQQLSEKQVVKTLSGSQLTVSNGCSADGVEVGNGIVVVSGDANEINKPVNNPTISFNETPLVFDSKKLARENLSIELLNSLVKDMQREADNYKTQPFTNGNNDQNGGASRTSTLRANPKTSNQMNGNANFKPPPFDHQQVTPTVLGTATLTRPSALKNGKNKMNNGNHHQNHNAIVVFDEKENNLKLSSSAINNSNSNLTQSKPTRISGRPYCDICSVYDLHHTIYCPKVSEKLASRHNGASNQENNNTSNIDNNNVDELFKDYERSLNQSPAAMDPSRQFASLRRNVKIVEKPPRPYCNHCDLYGHTMRNCNSLNV